MQREESRREENRGEEKLRGEFRQPVGKRKAHQRKLQIKQFSLYIKAPQERTALIFSAAKSLPIMFLTPRSNYRSPASSDLLSLAPVLNPLLSGKQTPRKNITLIEYRFPQ